MNGKISESIFSGETVIIAMADVQHIERSQDNYNKQKGGIWVITSHTKWNSDRGEWENPIYLNDEEAKSFIDAWCYYRYEKDIKSSERDS